MLCVHKAHLSWHHRHLVSDQRTLWEKNVLNRCWILSWWTVSMVITDCKTVLTIIPACVNLCRAGNYGKRCWYHRGLCPFCNQVWLRKGCFLHGKMLLGGEWGGGSSSEWLWKGLVTGGRRARRREEGMPPCSGLTICSDTSGPLHFWAASSHGRLHSCGFCLPTLSS